MNENDAAKQEYIEIEKDWILFRQKRAALIQEEEILFARSRASFSRLKQAGVTDRQKSASWRKAQKELKNGHK